MIYIRCKRCGGLVAAVETLREYRTILASLQGKTCRTCGKKYGKVDYKNIKIEGMGKWVIPKQKRKVKVHSS